MKTIEFTMPEITISYKDNVKASERIKILSSETSYSYPDRTKRRGQIDDSEKYHPAVIPDCRNSQHCVRKKKDYVF